MIRLTKLTKKYTNKTAVNGIHFQVQPGVVTGFLGPNGAGKSTTMRMILNLAIPTSGEVSVDGKDYKELDCPLQKIGAMLDAGTIDKRLTPKQYLQILATTAGLKKETVKEILSLVGLDEVQNRKIGEFSLGMRQRVGLAAALIGNPDTILLDEPFNGLDVDGIHWLRSIIRELAKQGKAVLISSHLLSEVQELADRVIVLVQGELIADMNMEELREKSLSSYVQVQSDNIGRLLEILKSKGAQAEITKEGYLVVHHMNAKKIGDIAFENDLRIYELKVNQPSLEQLFAELVEGKSEYPGKLSMEGKEYRYE